MGKTGKHSGTRSPGTKGQAKAPAQHQGNPEMKDMGSGKHMMPDGHMMSDAAMKKKMHK